MLGVKGGRGRGTKVEHHGGDGCNDVLQEMPPPLVTLFSLPALFVKGHGTKESVTGLLG